MIKPKDVHSYNEFDWKVVDDQEWVAYLYVAELEFWDDE